MYSVNGTQFTSFFKAIDAAKAVGADVVEVGTGLRRWTPAPKKAAPKTVHLLVNPDGTLTPFSKIKN